jgi:hypothetical protein
MNGLFKMCSKTAFTLFNNAGVVTSLFIPRIEACQSQMLMIQFVEGKKL